MGPLCCTDVLRDPGALVLGICGEAVGSLAGMTREVFWVYCISGIGVGLEVPEKKNRSSRDP
jgi:hypothetical protein